MSSSFEEALIEVWRQALVENASAVELNGNRYPVRRTPRAGLASGRFRVRWRRDSRAGAEPRYDIGVGADGAVG